MPSTFAEGFCLEFVCLSDKFCLINHTDTERFKECYVGKPKASLTSVLSFAVRKLIIHSLKFLLRWQGNIVQIIVDKVVSVNSHLVDEVVAKCECITALAPVGSLEDEMMFVISRPTLSSFLSSCLAHS